MPTHRCGWYARCNGLPPSEGSESAPTSWRSTRDSVWIGRNTLEGLAGRPSWQLEYMGGDSKHVFMAFEDDAEFLARLGPLLGRGLGNQELVIYASDADAADIGHRLRQIDGGEELLASDRFMTEPLHKVFAATEEASPSEALVDALQDGHEQARGRGLSRLRVFGVSTELASFAHWGRWEFEVGRRVVEERLTAICAYDATTVDRRTLGDLASLHQELKSRRPVTAFCLYPTPGGLALTGDVDAVSVPRLERALACVDPGPDRPLVIDVSGLTFLNHAGLLTIEGFARREDVPVRLVGASATVHKLHDVLDLDRSVLEVKP